LKQLRIYFFALACALSGTARSGGDSSDGHSHAEPEKPVVSVDVAPRASAQSEEFELVAVLASKKLTLYLDRYASNAPVAEARIELESGAVKIVAAQTEPGVYAVPGEPFSRPGKYPLVFSIQTAESADLLTATLEVIKPVSELTKPVIKTQDKRLVWGAAGALLLAGIGVVMMRRRK
jgi:hypothetical protein